MRRAREKGNIALTGKNKRENWGATALIKQFRHENCVCRLCALRLFGAPSFIPYSRTISVLAMQERSGEGGGLRCTEVNWRGTTKRLVIQ